MSRIWLDRTGEVEGASIDARAIQVRLAIQSKNWPGADVALSRLREVPGSEQKAVGLDAEIKLKRRGA
jgi:hypothetical protein